MLIFSNPASNTFPLVHGRLKKWKLKRKIIINDSAGGDVIEYEFDCVSQLDYDGKYSPTEEIEGVPL